MEIDPGDYFNDSQRLSQALAATGWAWSFQFEGPRKSQAFYWQRGEEYLIQLQYPNGRTALFGLLNQRMNLDQALTWVRERGTDAK